VVAPHASVHNRVTVAAKGAGNRQKHLAVFHHGIHRALVRRVCLSPHPALSAYTCPYEALAKRNRQKCVRPRIALRAEAITSAGRLP
jgi:hypothetical protein